MEKLLGMVVARGMTSLDRRALEITLTVPLRLDISEKSYPRDVIDLHLMIYHVPGYCPG